MQPIRTITLIRLAVLTLALAGGTARLPAASYYCDPASGSMSNSGTSGSPWSTLQAVFDANKTFAAGDVIYLRDGFHGSPTVTGIFSSGNATIQAQSGHSPKLKKLTFNNAKHWVVSGLDISPRNAVPAVWDNAEIVTIPDNSSFITISGCHVYYATSVTGWSAGDFKPRMGRAFSCEGPDCTINNNEITYVRFAVQVFKTAPRTAVRYNLVEWVMDDALRFHADDTTIEYNTIRNFFGVDSNHDDGIQGWTEGAGGIGSGHIYGGQIRGNTIINSTGPGNPFPDTYGVQGIFLGAGMYEDLVIENNLLALDMPHGIAIFGAINCKIVNNTVMKNPYDQLNKKPWITIRPNNQTGELSSGSVINNNIVWWDPSSDYQVQGATQSHNIVTTDYAALFVNYAGYDFHLKSTSSAVGGGTTTDAPSIDIEGTTRSVPYDAGAYEFGLPAAPSALSLSAQAYNQINLSWTDNASNETGFRIERKKGSGGTYTEIDTTAANVTTYSDTTCGVGTNYYYRVRANNAAGNSPFSAEQNASSMEITSGRRAHWKLDASSGTTVTDSSGNGNNGTTSGGPTWVAAKISNGLNLDGADDVVNCGSGSTLDNLPAVTVAAWIKADTLGGGAQGRIAVKGTGITPAPGWHFHVTLTNQLNFLVNYSTTDMQRISATNAISLGAWRHVLVTWTGSATATNVKFYVDGAEVSYSTTTNGSGTRSDDGTANFYLGNESGGTRGFDGVLDDVRVYDRVLSGAEITAIYRAGL